MSDALLRDAKRLAEEPYHIDIEREPGDLPPHIPRYTAFIREMPYCVAQGFTEEEARTEIRSVLVDYILSQLVRNVDVPEPEIASVDRTTDYAVYWLREDYFLHASKAFMDQSTSPQKPLQTFIYAHSE